MAREPEVEDPIMKFRSQRVAYLFFASSMLLFALQIVFGFIMGSMPSVQFTRP